jgi:hypothetical protein
METKSLEYFLMVMAAAVLARLAYSFIEPALK